MQLAETNFPAVIDTLLPELVHPSRLNDTSIVDVITAMANSVGKEAFLRQQRAMIGCIDNRPFLHQIECPTLVLCGREDVITPIEGHEEMVAAISLSESSTLRVPVGPVAGTLAAAPATLADAERQHILAALHQTGWRVRGPDGAATLLGLKPTTLESRLKTLGLQRPR